MAELKNRTSNADWRYKRWASFILNSRLSSSLSDSLKMAALELHGMHFFSLTTVTNMCTYVHNYQHNYYLVPNRGQLISSPDPTLCEGNSLGTLQRFIDCAVCTNITITLFHVYREISRVVKARIAQVPQAWVHCSLDDKWYFLYAWKLIIDLSY